MPSLNREQFLATLDSCVPGLAQKEIIDQSRCFVFKDGTIYSFNDECACRAPSPLGTLEGAVHHEKLLNCLRKLQEEAIDISLKDGELLVKGKNKLGRFRMEAKISMPIEAIETPRPEDWQKLNETFGEAIALVQQCAGKDDNKFSVTCVHVTPNWVEAGDYFQICRWTLSTGFTQPIMMRRNAIRHVAGMGATEFAETERWTHFRNARGLILSCRRYTDVSEYPDLTPCMAVTGDPLSLPKALAEAIDRAQDFVAPQGNDNDQLSIELRPGPANKGAIKISGTDGMDRYEEVKRVDYSGQPLSFKMPPGVFNDIVKKHGECQVTDDQLIVCGSSYKFITGTTKPSNGKVEVEE